MTGPTSYIMGYVSGAQQDYMLDKAMVRRFQVAGSVDDYGTPQVAFVDGPELTCSFDDQRAKEGHTTAQVDVHDAVIRFPFGTIIDAHDRVLLTWRMGVRLDPSIEYEIDGDIRRGPFGVVCPLKLYVGSDNA